MYIHICYICIHMHIYKYIHIHTHVSAHHATPVSYICAYHIAYDITYLLRVIPYTLLHNVTYNIVCDIAYYVICANPGFHMICKNIALHMALIHRPYMVHGMDHMCACVWREVGMPLHLLRYHVVYHSDWLPLSQDGRWSNSDIIHECMRQP